jgi:hypothetical protein
MIVAAHQAGNQPKVAWWLSWLFLESEYYSEANENQCDDEIEEYLLEVCLMH